MQNILVSLGLRRKPKTPAQRVQCWVSWSDNTLHITRDTCFDEFATHVRFDTRRFPDVHTDIQHCAHVSRLAASIHPMVDAPPLCLQLLEDFPEIKLIIILGSVITIKLQYDLYPEHQFRQAVLAKIIAHQERYNPL